MPVTFCPSEIAWGDVGTWVAASSTFAVGLLAVLTSRKATDIAERAREISQEATRIANEHLAEVQRTREETAKVTLALIESEISIHIARLHWVCEHFINAIEWDESPTIKSKKNMDLANRAISELALPNIESVLDRLHSLPNGLGEKIAEALGLTRAIRMQMEGIAEHISYKDLGDGQWAIQFKAKPDTLRMVMQQFHRTLLVCVDAHDLMAAAMARAPAAFEPTRVLLVGLKLRYTAPAAGQ